MDTIKINKQNAKLIAHRGVSGLEVENTAAAFVAAGNRSYYGVETDIYRTADGRFAVSHDPTLKRLSGENVAVEEVSLPVLQSIVFYDRNGGKDRVDLRPCSLENYLGICKKYEKHCVLELKSSFTDEETERIIETVKGFGYLENVTFISFDYGNLVRVRSVLPDQSAQFLFGECNDEIIGRLIADRIDADVYFGGIGREQIEKLHSAGRKVNCWTVDDPETAERLIGWGVDLITSNILE